MNDEVFEAEIKDLGLSQIYLNRKKIDAVEKWYCIRKTDEYEPLPVYDFGDGKLTLTDGHSRAFVAYKLGIQKVRVQYDHDETVTGTIGQKLYRQTLIWCKRFSIDAIGKLEDRIISNEDYAFYWIERCDRSYNLITKTSDKQFQDFSLKFKNLLLYGADKDLTHLYYENLTGELWDYDAVNKSLAAERKPYRG